MANEIDDDVMPVFLINGFLEAGKTQFLSFTMDQEYFKTDGKTLLIVCEEGAEVFLPNPVFPRVFLGSERTLVRSWGLSRRQRR